MPDVPNTSIIDGNVVRGSGAQESAVMSPGFAR